MYFLPPTRISLLNILSSTSSTCVLAPELMEGPYYINNEMIRNNLIEDQAGIRLTLDVAVIDVTTCEPMEDVLVEIWAANATGIYSHGNFPGATLQRNETFLRGGYPTGPDGLAELVTIYPGFYARRTAHVHAMIHMNWDKSENGTFVSSSGSVLHIGQFFFQEEWNDKVYATSPYTENTNKRTYNDEDKTVDDSEDADGNSAFIDLHLAGEDITDGLIGFITVGVNPQASYSIKNKNYLNSTGPSQ
ncbi:aromatic compound dioxygenase [Gymnopus androsaceus JB14]|uniref:Aromatic compound dioxygenase n=1 Tax=Gymnopus androsaceus JB14 TaxID=1447944 RepID=A0A6A4HUC0_9AGAR|nr:aromatic compound dioxygenase [Gymnopus androsaceus JB14]